MATLRQVCRLLGRNSTPVCQRNLSTTSVVAYWNKDWKPGPLPRTPEERAIAAKKYGLRPEDYDVLSDGMSGDYPNLPIVNKDWRDPFENYDNPGAKRNFGEPIHRDYELPGNDLFDSNADGVYTYGQIITRFLLLCGTFLGLHYLLAPYPYHLPEMPKQYPFNNLYLEKGGDPANEPEVKHYTFKPPC